MKKLILLVIGILLCGVLTILTADTNIGISVKWLGYVTYATDYNGVDPGIFGDLRPSQQSDTRYEIGLRSDGVVVWKDVVKPIHLALSK